MQQTDAMCPGDGKPWRAVSMRSVRARSASRFVPVRPTTIAPSVPRSMDIAGEHASHTDSVFEETGNLRVHFKRFMMNCTRSISASNRRKGDG
jgi:hypothetical protein